MVETHFDFWKGFVRKCVCLEMHFDHRRGSVTQLDVCYTCFDLLKGCVRMVDLLEMHFEIRKCCVCMVDVWYMCFDICKNCENGRCSKSKF